MNTLIKTLTLGTLLTVSAQVQAQTRYNSSDVIKYALSSHGITYLLRDKRGSVNAWKQENKLERFNVQSKRWGNTDCSGLVSAAIRFRGYSAPERKGKPALSTALIATSAQKKQNGLSFIGGNARSSAKHGDMFNYTKSPYGHVFFYNGQTSGGLISTVEAKCTKCGVGTFTKSWNDVAKGNFRLVRANNIVHDISNANQIIPLSQADAGNRTSNGKVTSTAQASAPDSLGRTTATASGKQYTVKSGDTGAKIARSQGVTLQALQKANPGLNWGRLQVGQKIKLP